MAQAIRICLEGLRGRSWPVFDEYDYWLASEVSTRADADPIEIDHRFRQPEPDTWTRDHPGAG